MSSVDTLSFSSSCSFVSFVDHFFHWLRLGRSLALPMDIMAALQTPLQDLPAGVQIDAAMLSQPRHTVLLQLSDDWRDAGAIDTVVPKPRFKAETLVLRPALFGKD
ncbi:MAG: hypothetical protein BECKG1743D_GA0114223_103613 [Candidatus Kentron sp. G]|nr:MAG: hypothetical protein BECKG1743F_GA0114225_103022 [Candidatus Kentron sp. G]VFN00209.1 MAG: hypothetical protein BECKG1743E_GA0114224_103123 [Candidatus Kentron sp. G]VFN02391.1 MAG: hypothetical protein BECKG1743D_GA0114223_103613 [Candidatus Kentron sp. G]